MELTGDFVKAVLLQQMLYWSERVQDFKQFAQEELQRAKMESRRRWTERRIRRWYDLRLGV